MLNHYNYYSKLHLLEDELSKIYASLFLKFFALDMVNIFVPIYFLTLGFSLENILYFYLVMFVTIGITSPFSAFVSKRFGFNVPILLSIPLLIFYLSSIYAIKPLDLTFPLIYLLAIVDGISAALYWVPLSSIFAIHSDKQHRGIQVGKLHIFQKVSSIIAPTLGGTIALFFGFPVLFLLAAFLLFLSVIPLFFGRGNVKSNIEFSFNKIFSKTHTPFLFAFMSQGILYISSMIFWPIFVYLLLTDTISVGLIVTISTIGTLAFTYFVGKSSDSFNRGTIMKIGGILFSITWFVRTFVKTKLWVFGLSLIAGMFAVLIDIPFGATWLDKANKENPVEFVVFREINLNLGRALLLIIAIFAANTFLVSFSLAGLASLFFTFF